MARWPSRRSIPKQSGIVNVPVSVDTTVSQLPRAYDDTHIVHLKLAKRIEYQRNYAHGNVRPHVVWEAAQFLKDQPLYREHGIHLSENWLSEATDILNKR